MDQGQFYQWMDRLLRQFGCLGKWQALGLAEQCQLTKVAEHLGMWGKADSVERRLQRWLSNERIEMKECAAAWIRWVWQEYAGDKAVVLVDETRLGNHLGVMMVGLAYEGRCIPLLWQCYGANNKAAYPPEGQVGMIIGLLCQLQAALPADTLILVQADRGIGNSGTLMRQLEQHRMSFLLRVKRRTLFRPRSATKSARPLSALIKPGETWSGRGWIFKTSKMMRVYVLLAWQVGQPEPWCLVTNDPSLKAQTYALRMWQEEGFRDLKSFGWRWNASHVWQPTHANRLLLVLALAYAWVISQEPPLRSQFLSLVQRGLPSRFSVFRRALRFVRLALARSFPLRFDLCFVPSHPYV
jgi:hypothetical protein